MTSALHLIELDGCLHTGMLERKLQREYKKVIGGHLIILKNKKKKKQKTK